MEFLTVLSPEWNFLPPSLHSTASPPPLSIPQPNCRTWRTSSFSRNPLPRTFPTNAAWPQPPGSPVPTSMAAHSHSDNSMPHYSVFLSDGCQEVFWTPFKSHGSNRGPDGMCGLFLITVMPIFQYGFNCGGGGVLQSPNLGLSPAWVVPVSWPGPLLRSCVPQSEEEASVKSLSIPQACHFLECNSNAIPMDLCVHCLIPSN